MVATVGEAGGGKSRLVYELVHADHIRGWLVLESASGSYGKAMAYFPVLESAQALYARGSAVV